MTFRSRPAAFSRARPRLRRNSRGPRSSPSLRCRPGVGGRKGYVDLRFDITQRGEARSIEVLDASAGAADAYKDRLVELIHDSLFRPRAANGHFARRAPVSIRYYVNE